MKIWNDHINKQLPIFLSVPAYLKTDFCEEGKISLSRCWIIGYFSQVFIGTVTTRKVAITWNLFDKSSYLNIDLVVWDHLEARKCSILCSILICYNYFDYSEIYGTEKAGFEIRINMENNLVRNKFTAANSIPDFLY